MHPIILSEPKDEKFLNSGVSVLFLLIIIYSVL